MKWSLLLYGAILVCLSGCQHLPPLYSTQKPPAMHTELAQLMEYGAKFASEYEGATKETCAKYKQLYQQGDWQAGWILALHVTDTKQKNCLNSKQAIQILTTLESDNLINSEIIWLTHIHLNWLAELELQTKKASRIKRLINRKQVQINELKKENQDLVEKLEALKAIETSINQ
ncbi:MAG: hypothetical protein DRQ62_16150 [Gammaproteobacteria bacterium]|nr:MAG: hypothetical protein DRQ62_16150 [Gammaproteobacteria bacterium]